VQGRIGPEIASKKIFNVQRQGPNRGKKKKKKKVRRRKKRIGAVHVAAI